MRPNYNKAVRGSINVLMDFGFNTIPIDLDIIFKKYKRTIRKCSYSKFASKRGLSIEEVCEYFESDLGACAYDRKSERYIIYYNDTKNNGQLDRFTIAHELGHVFLRHYDEVDGDVLLRKRIPGRKYKRLEDEANCFARNLLSPVPLVDKYIDMDSGFASQELQDAFGIGLLASHTRAQILILDRYRITSQDYEYFNTYNITFGYNCSYCGNADIEQLDYCKICGEKNQPFEKNHGVFYNDGIETNESGRVVKCPVCDNEVFTEGLYYCKICGTPRYNYCTDTEGFSCGQPNDGNARYCRDCGSETVYFEKGLLDKIGGAVNDL